MVDNLLPSSRSLLMSKVRSQDTVPELVVRRTTHALGFRFRLHSRSLPGTPDIVLPKYRSVIFVHGCFWHGHRRCRKSKRPTTNISFWDEKLGKNERRDKSNILKLRKLGWRVLVIWECQTHRLLALENLISRFLTGAVQSTRGAK